MRRKEVRVVLETDEVELLDTSGDGVEMRGKELFGLEVSDDLFHKAEDVFS